MVETKIFDGRLAAQEIKEELKKEASEMNLKPGLAVILVGSDPNSQSYVKQKEKACQNLGWNFTLFNRNKSVNFKELEDLLKNLNQNPSIHGIILQLPLPEKLSPGHLLGLIDGKKDVDGLNPFSPLTPPTAQAVLHVLLKNKIRLQDAKVIVLGRGKTAGKPITEILKKRGAKVFVANSQTPSLILNSHLLNSDVVISAVGKPNLITGGMIKEGAVVIGVGLSRETNSEQRLASSDTELNLSTNQTNAKRSTLNAHIVGDLNEPSLIGKASLITPTPGGIGPLTVAFLLRNLLKAAQKDA